MKRWVGICILGLLTIPPTTSATPSPMPPTVVRGMTISCQTYGPEWGTDGFAEELDELKAMGVNWIAIHPYARISANGQVGSRLDPKRPPRWLTRPIEEAHARGMSIMIKPHLAYWGSPFSWRGEIDFDDPVARARFFASYTRWITDVAEVTAGADAFVVGTELDKLVEHEASWRAVIAAIRARTSARLTYAANWTDYQRVPLWDALDAVGVQAYFPLVPEARAGEPVTDEVLLTGWRRVLAELRSVHQRTGKPVVFTELGYSMTPVAATKPWAHERPGFLGQQAAAALQRRCLEVALKMLDEERDWLRGAFLWKWFVGAAPGEDFMVDAPHLLPVLSERWGR